MKNRIGWKTWICILLSALLLSYGCASRGVVYKPDTLEKTVQKTPAKVETPPSAKTEEAKERAPGYEDLKSPEFKRPFCEKNLPPKRAI